MSDTNIQQAQPVKKETRCLFCGKPKNPAIPDDDYNVFVEDNNPCPECLAKFRKGIAVFAVTHRMHIPEQRPVASSCGFDFYLNGDFVVISATDAKIFLPEQIRESSIKERKCFVDPDIVENIAKAAPNAERSPLYKN